MSNSPYVPNDIKQYLRKFKIQETINETINSLLKQKPQEPYSYLIGQFQKKSVPDIQIEDIEMIQVLCGEGFPAIKIKATVNYLNQTLKFYIDQVLGISSQQNNIFDADGIQGKGMKSGIQFYDNQIRPILKNRKFKTSQQQQIDSQIVKVFRNNQSKGLYQINCISFAVPLVKSRIFYQPLYKIYSELAQKQIKHQTIPRFMINCLQGGKAIGSKCKVFKYYLISESKQSISLIPAVLQNVKKTITSGKGGQAALKYSPDGTFVCPVDTIMDNFKIIQEAISNAGAKQHLTVGLSWMSDTLYNSDTKKYQLQNPKTPFDNDQMIDYLVKLLTDKPIITYLEDPLASSEIPSWAKFINKIRQTQPLKKVRVGTRNGNLLNLHNQNLKQKLQQLCVPLSQDSHPDLSPEQRTQKNNQKIRLDFIQIRATQLHTVSNLLKVSKQLNKLSTQLILQDNVYETSNTDLVDICYGLGSYCNLGSVVKFDRLSKIYRAEEILREKYNQ